ncbi:hypothetical protein [Sphingomonas aerophila]|uniref:Uncharacterized protein n=1 Tax=Sphingomonas aerophila TaxID=1344948 RepID=A0A7W9BFB4_9SPHN|nr:hypothetical protein [Sphingomonas aerophila]MBB5716116.1 hypothetical protein [Sphingomonas aerophila]
MDFKKLGLGLVAFTAGVVAWSVGAARFGPRPGRQPFSPPARPTDPRTDAADVGAVFGDSVTAPLAPRPATLAAAPVGMAETEKALPRGEPNPAAEHVPTDLLGDEPPRPGDRAPEAFRPDPTAVPTPEEREALRPATGPAPTLVADRGSGFSEAAGAA